MNNIKITLSAVTFCAISTPAFAYLDPGTGSLIIQAIIGGIAAFGLTVKIYWYKLRMIFGRKSGGKEDYSSKDPEA